MMGSEAARLSRHLLDTTVILQQLSNLVPQGWLEPWTERLFRAGETRPEVNFSLASFCISQSFCDGCCLLLSPTGVVVVKTDEYFYEFFRTHPAELLRLSGQNVSGPVHFESVTVKQRERQEKRLDGLLTRTDGQPDRLLFAEFQGYLDRAIYWRALRSVAMYHEYLPETSPVPILVVLLFLAKDHDPDFDLLTFNPPHKLLRIYLPEALERLEGNLGPLVVFKPLFARDPEELREQGPEWVRVIQDLKSSEKDRTFLIEALMYAMVQRFPTRDVKELMNMFVLTPLEETVTVQNIMARSRAEGQAQGVARGERIGKIHLLQQLLGRPLTPAEELLPQSIEALDALVMQLKAEIH